MLAPDKVDSASDYPKPIIKTRSKREQVKTIIKNPAPQVYSKAHPTSGSA